MAPTVTDEVFFEALDTFSEVRAYYKRMGWEENPKDIMRDALGVAAIQSAKNDNEFEGEL